MWLSVGPFGAPRFDQPWHPHIVGANSDSASSVDGATVPKAALLPFGVYALNAFVGWMSLSAAHKREVQFLANLGIFLAFILLVRPSRLKRLEGATRPQRIFLFGMRLAVAILGGSLVANLFGYVKLAQSLGYLSLYSTFIAISVLTGVRVFTLLLLAGIDVPAAQQVAAVRLHHDGIARWVPRILRWSGTFIWLIATLDLMASATRSPSGSPMSSTSTLPAVPPMSRWAAWWLLLDPAGRICHLQRAPFSAARGTPQPFSLVTRSA